MWTRDINEVRSKKRNPLTVIGCGTSYDLYDDLDERIAGTDVFALNAAVTRHWRHSEDNAFWWFAHDMNRILSSPFKELFLSRLSEWEQWRLVTWAGWLDKKFNEAFKIPDNSLLWLYGEEYRTPLIRNTFARAMETAIKWGYTDIRLIGIDMKVKKKVREPQMVYREYTQYYADAFLWKPRPGDNLRKWRADAVKTAPRWLRDAKITLGKHSLWLEFPRCPFPSE